MSSTEPPPGRGTAFLVVGECVADIVRTPGRPDVVRPGGSPANVAYGLARLGHAPTLLTQTGDDPSGAAVRARLSGAGVSLPAPGGAPVRTPSAVVSLDEAGRADYAFDIAWTLPPRGTVPGPPPDHLHFGSIAATMEPGAAGVRALVERLRPTATVSYDINIRPQLLGGQAESAALVERNAVRCDLVKASDEDLDWLHPGRSPDEVADGWLELGVGLVLITLGARGALVRTPTERVTVPAGRTVVVDTVGAGDAFMTGALDALAHIGALARASLPGLTRAELSRVAAHATVAATLTVARSGAALPGRTELGLP
ncbi:carbohydrate kinase family protein [Streptomyces profundus]|uniref:carbohydrate kinase family protein n=1 Tax=Streptomyces profundus TaxID=2867410 RepID=UPI001D16CC8D|nr:carbohydrate kinase [Streptomyces sp. MA3_2.13]UED83891.1 carbohydrate kinase [Streptomyces sp. MA3_2.13]